MSDCQILRLQELPRRKESATISMPEKPARGAAEGPETGLWDAHPSPTSPLDFMDDMQGERPNRPNIT